MKEKDQFKSVQTGPVLGQEPNLLHDLPQDKIVSALISLASELYIVRDRVRTLESELEKTKALKAGAVEGHQDTEEEHKARAADAQAFANRFWYQLIKPDEPVSKINPDMKKFL
jgi:hypothetical protein